MIVMTVVIAVVLMIMWMWMRMMRTMIYIYISDDDQFHLLPKAVIHPVRRLLVFCFALAGTFMRWFLLLFLPSSRSSYSVRQGHARGGILHQSKEPALHNICPGNIRMQKAA